MIPTIEAINLCKKFDSFPAVSNLNLKIEGSKCVGFLGPNGAGKTTTLKIFTNLIRQTSGEALINGIDVNTNKTEALACVGSLIEVPEIYPYLTSREALTMIAKIRGIPKTEWSQQISEKIAEVHMEEWIDKRVGTFSKGMKQRVTLAAALIGDPCILFLDEPTQGLDPRGMNEIREIIKELKSKGRLIFMSSHLLAEVTDICDEIAMIHNGILLDYDTISNIIAKFTEGKTTIEISLRTAAEDGILVRNFTALENVITADKIDDKNYKIQFTGNLEVQEQILTSIVEMNIGMISFKRAWSELEDVYLRLIQDVK